MLKTTRSGPFGGLMTAMACIALASLAACSGAEEAGTTGTAATQPSQSLKDTLASQGELSTLNKALADTGLVGIFENSGGYTIMAPDNAAFDKLGEPGKNLMQDDQTAALAAFLRELILPGVITIEDIRKSIADSDGKPVSMATMGSGEVTFSLEGDKLIATSDSGAKAVIAKDAIAATNGALIPTDVVLNSLPEAE